MIAGGDLAATLDSTLLRPDASDSDVKELARHARDAGCAAVCVAARRLPAVVKTLGNGPPVAAGVVSFPAGASAASSKKFEALDALRLGATELDVVCDLDAVRRGDVGALEREIGELMECTPEAVHKFIVEVAWLPAGAWKRLGKAVARLKPAFIKTGTGVNAGSVTVEQVSRLREVTRGEVPIKAAGGIRTAAQARRLLAAGAARLGTSAAAAILAEISSEA